MEENLQKRNKPDFFATISYLTLFGTLISFFYYKNSASKNKITLFHIRQALGVLLFFGLVNFLLLKFFASNNLVLNKADITNNLQDFSTSDYNKYTITKYPLTAGNGFTKVIDIAHTEYFIIDDTLRKQIIPREFILSSQNLSKQFIFPIYYLARKVLADNELNGSWVGYDVTMKMKASEREKLYEKIVTEGANAEQANITITSSQFQGEATQYENSLQLIHYPFVTERNRELNNYLINMLDEGNRQKINLLKSKGDIEFTEGIIFWCIQVLCVISIFIGIIGSLLGNRLSIPLLGKLFQVLFGFIK